MMKVEQIFECWAENAKKEMTVRLELALVQKRLREMTDRKRFYLKALAEAVEHNPDHPLADSIHSLVAFTKSR